MTTKTRGARKQSKRAAQLPINQAAIDLLVSWCEGDEEDEREQRETMQYLRKALDEGRPRELKHFP